MKKINNLEAQVATLKVENNLSQNTIATQKQKIFLLQEELVLVKYDKNDSNITKSDTNTTNNITHDMNATIENQKFQQKEKSVFDTL